jgi:hypothetical protein
LAPFDEVLTVFPLRPLFPLPLLPPPPLLEPPLLPPPPEPEPEPPLEKAKAHANISTRPVNFLLILICDFLLNFQKGLARKPANRFPAGSNSSRSHGQ